MTHTAKHKKKSACLRIITRSERETVRLGRSLAHCVRAGMTVALVGTLGSGKTTLVKGIVAGRLPAAAVHVKSPSFTVINQYPGAVPIYHIDCYRIDDPAELAYIGIDECIFGTGITVIEWADKITTLLPPACVMITLKQGGKERRIITIRSADADFMACVRRRIHA